MSAFDDLNTKLDAAKGDLEKIVSEFRQVVQLGASLEATDSSLRSAAKDLTTLTKALALSTEKLAECLAEIRSAVDYLGHIDVSEIKRGEHSIGDRMIGLRRAVERVEEQFQKSATRQWILFVVLVAVLGVSLLSLYLSHGTFLLGLFG